jgi:hypothetical protein
MGVGKDGTPTGNYQPGVQLQAKYTLFAEGCRGSQPLYVLNVEYGQSAGQGARPCLTGLKWRSSM